MKCLIIMPFARQFDAVHETIKQSVTDALHGQNVRTVRLDEVRIAGRITSQLIDALRSADFYIADITGHNANVMWEIGFAAAVGRPAIFISQSGDPLPFDVKDERIVRYNRRKLETTLYHPLKQAMWETLRTNTQPERKMVVTGTGTVHVMRAYVLLSAILEPYLRRQIWWYCTANGTTDEVALDLLGKKGEKVTAVFDSVYRVTPRAREIIEAHKLDIIDATVEVDPEDYAVSGSLQVVQVNQPPTGEIAQLPSNAMDLLIEYSDLMILLGNPDEGRARTLIQGANKRRRPYLVVRP